LADIPIALDLEACSQAADKQEPHALIQELGFCVPLRREEDTSAARTTNDLNRRTFLPAAIAHKRSPFSDQVESLSAPSCRNKPGHDGQMVKRSRPKHVRGRAQTAAGTIPA